MKNKSKNCGKYCCFVFAILILDQLTKLLIKNNFNLNESFVLIRNFLNITYITNTGSLFGILRGTNIYLIWFSLIVLGLIMFYWHEINKKDRLFFALITGGILGNLVDRIAYGFVVDFISFSFWPAFNVADSAICIGIIGLIYYSLKD